MSINTLLDTLVTRAAGLVDAANVVKRPRQFHEDELPAVAVYRGRAQVAEQHIGQASKSDVPFYLEYHKEATTDDPAAEAEAMVNAVIAAVEVDSRTDCGIFNLAGDEVKLPDDGSDVISVQVAFEAEIIRRYGG